MTLLLNQLFTQKKSGIIQIMVPTVSNVSRLSRGDVPGTLTITGILTNDPKVRVQNQWGNIFPSGEDFNDILQTFGSRNLFSWVSASAAAWKSSEPISIAVDFYLLSYNKNSNIKGQASALMSLAGLVAGEGGALSEAAVNVHGGYTIEDLFKGNHAVNKDNVLDYIQSAAGKLSQSSRKGTVTIKIGDQFTLRNMLLQDCDVELSSVQVASGIPLYIKVSAMFRMFRAPLVSDITGMFGA